MASVFVPWSCGRPADPVDRLLASLLEAADERDADAVLEHLDEEFRGEGGMGRVEAGAELRRLFSLYESVEVLTSESERDATGSELRVRTRVDFSGRPKNLPGLAGLLPDAAAYRFELTLRPHEDRLRVAAASWSRLDLTAPEPPPQP
jgi:hypothetical protein